MWQNAAPAASPSAAARAAVHVARYTTSFQAYTVHDAGSTATAILASITSALTLNGQRGEVYGAHSTLGREVDRFESGLPDCEHKDVLA